ncbi:MAG: TfoX/Sxy family protein [Candidatus Nanopelagicales bacterium]|nr:TfoX/Sxy family protein [Candidatus Nanopelagicales bacterium]
MEIPKPSDQAKALFRDLIPDVPGVAVKPMFGNLGAYINGNMFAGLFGEDLGVKLIEKSSRDELTAIDGTGPFGPAERPMGGYTSLPSTWASMPTMASSWVQRAMLEVGALPPKKARVKK